MPDDATKRCTYCGETKPVDAFARNRRVPDGRFAWCRECVRQRGKAKRQATRPATEGTKACTKCGEVKPVTGFSPGSGKGGRKAWCRDCCNADHSRYYGTRSDAVRDAAYERTQRWREANPDTVREGARARAAKIKAQVFEHYGTVCACCGAAETLSIDHIAGGGTQHRQELFGNGWSASRFWRWLVLQGFPPGYQVLCGSCNSSKAGTEACRLH